MATTLSGVTLPTLGQAYMYWMDAVDGTVRALEQRTATTTNLVATTVDTTNSTVTGVVVTGLEIPSGLAAGVYAIDGTLLVTSADTGTGVQLAVASTSNVTPAVVWWVPQGGTQAATQYDRVGNVYAALTASAFSGGSPLPALIRGSLVVTATTTSPIQILLRSEVAGSAVAVKTGSFLSWKLATTSIPISGGTGGGGTSTTPVNPTGTLIFQDAFVGADGAAWGANWSGGVTGTNGAAVTINTNRGMLKSGATGYPANTDKVARNYTAQVANFHALFSFQFDASVTETYPALLFRDNLANGDVQNGYEVRFLLDRLELNKVTGYVGTTLGSTTRAHTKGAKWWCRVKAIGSALQARTWLDGTIEPSTWDISVTDATYGAAGWLGFYTTGSGTGGGSQIVYVDDVYVAQS